MKSQLTALLVAAILGLAVQRAAATECGVNNKKLMAPFAGQWREKTGSSYDVAPGKINHTFAVHLVTGDETKHLTSHFVLAGHGEDTDGSMLDCRDLMPAERDSIERKMANLAGAVGVPNSDADRENQQEIAQFRKYLVRPPYRMMAATHYEDQQWLILLKPTRLLDVWYGEGMFSVQVYERITVSQPVKRSP